MIQVIDKSQDGVMEIFVDEPDYKDHFEISAEIFKHAYVMDGGDNLRSVCLARQRFFAEHPEEKLAWDSQWVLSHQNR